MTLWSWWQHYKYRPGYYYYYLDDKLPVSRWNYEDCFSLHYDYDDDDDADEKMRWSIESSIHLSLILDHVDAQCVQTVELRVKSPTRLLWQKLYCARCNRL